MQNHHHPKADPNADRRATITLMKLVILGTLLAAFDKQKSMQLRSVGSLYGMWQQLTSRHQCNIAVFVWSTTCWKCVTCKTINFVIFTEIAIGTAH
jgi:hypothetical protein